MKKYVHVIFMIASTSFAQDGQLLSIMQNESQVMSLPYKQGSLTNTIINQGAYDVARSTVNFIPIGTSYNIYTTLYTCQNQVSYHPDINAIAFVHRQNAGTDGGSGGISFDLSTDNGLSWTTNTILTPDFNLNIEVPNSSGNRYPNIALWNFTGNTNPLNAFVLSHGASLSAATGSWGMSGAFSIQLDGDFPQEDYDNYFDSDSDYLSLGLHYYSDGTLWDMTAKLDFSSIMLNRHSFNPVIKKFERTQSLIEQDLYMVDGIYPVGNLQSYQVNFDAGGNVGYALLIGALATDAVKTVAPVIYKSGDSGSTWEQLPLINWATIPEISAYLSPVIGGSGTIIPYFRNIDATVGDDLRLHIFAEVYSRTSDDAENNINEFDEDFLFLMHFSTSDGTDWTASVIDSSLLDIANFGVIPITYSPQLSRTSDGTKLFFSWTNSDPAFHTAHEAPDIWVKGYDLETGFYTPNIMVTNGTDFEQQAYFPTMAPVVIDPGSGTYELPIVFTDPGANDLSTAQFYYIQGLTIADEDFETLPFPEAFFAAGTYGETIVFENSSLYASSYYWDFGDGFFSTLENPEHTFPGPGEYVVCLTATNAVGSDEYCGNISIAATCTPPTDITPILISSTLARYTWDAVPGATKYQFQYRPTGTTTWLKKNATTTLVKITGLSPATTYQYRMKTFCGTESSVFSDGGFFTTTARIGEFSDQEILIYPNPASQTVFIDGLGIEEDMLTITCHDITGRLLLSEVFMHYGQIVEVSVESLLPGTYMLQVQKGDELYTEMLVIQ